MSTKFDPKNKIIRLCMLGMNMEDQGNSEEASALFLQALNESVNDFERFIAAYQVAKHKKDISDKLKWMEKALEYAIKSNDDSVKSAFPTIYLSISKCYEELGDSDKAKANYELSNSSNTEPYDKGPFYHGTRADLKIGDLLVAGRNSNYNSEVKMNHIYFTSNLNGAGLAAGLAKGEGREHVYIVEPTGAFENDPNITDKKFPGNLTCSYRSQAPLRIVGEKTDWMEQTPEELSQWSKKLANTKGEIIN
ncbi:NAD(+)--rifampin ADP-ribosyltransferase [Clostridium sp. DSM 100503]|uniref:NAD(+)--rifampin ADP-ribosyltransferase n=1 Tax=Clostridium sp. DSM 100503 TaxID=2963282 RepID=UPI00214A0C92|nr:NAD(+)--rifampin ADP-ribosyltransferase [Clostridium sp. DSM 100503]MCR1951579.1 NAD(+)--rifampin ADP-ribosyltransferase [Clostridium sp. DSM 100503]